MDEQSELGDKSDVECQDNEETVVSLSKTLDTSNEKYSIGLKGTDPSDIAVLYIDKGFSHRLLLLQAKAMKNQYLLACLSTLGGAYHLCNNPKVALSIAKKQEFLGKHLDSSSVIFKAKVFQGVNLSLLGKTNKSKKKFIECEEYLRKVADRDTESAESMNRFLIASRRWLETQDMVSSEVPLIMPNDHTL